MQEGECDRFFDRFRCILVARKENLTGFSTGWFPSLSGVVKDNVIVVAGLGFDYQASCIDRCVTISSRPLRCLLGEAALPRPYAAEIGPTTHTLRRNDASIVKI